MIHVSTERDNERLKQVITLEQDLLAVVVRVKDGVAHIRITEAHSITNLAIKEGERCLFHAAPVLDSSGSSMTKRSITKGRAEE